MNSITMETHLQKKLNEHQPDHNLKHRNKEVGAGTVLGLSSFNSIGASRLQYLL